MSPENASGIFRATLGVLIVLDDEEDVSGFEVSTIKP
jgi:hypothetical protein